ncbi:MAG: hypothetical protein AAFO69_20430 [Bacteroidota bacterium]
MSRWQKIFSDELLYRAEIVKAVLEDHQIDVIILNNKDSNYHWGTHDLMVTPENVLEAIKIIKDKINFE